MGRPSHPPRRGGRRRRRPSGRPEQPARAAERAKGAARRAPGAGRDRAAGGGRRAQAGQGSGALAPGSPGLSPCSRARAAPSQPGGRLPTTRLRRRRGAASVLPDYACAREGPRAPPFFLFSRPLQRTWTDNRREKTGFLPIAGRVGGVGGGKRVGSLERGNEEGGGRTKKMGNRKKGPWASWPMNTAEV